MASSINTIDLDVDTIDVSEYPVPHYGDKPRADAYDKTLCQDNKDFTNFLNRCLMLEQSFEMEKIIGKILLPAYVCADDEYKKSEKFTKVIKKALQRLIDEPRKKYSHISDITDTLKFHVKKLPKKRVDFVTLSTNSVLDSQNINLQEEMQFYNNERNTVVNVDTNKFEHNKDTHHDKENLDKNENLCDSNNKLLVPRMEIILEEEKTPKKLDDTKRFERIKGIETEILKYKKKIADLELAEVTEDSSVSAYIRCDRLQAHIVKLYKELCSLNDAEPVKGRKVRLKHVAEGLPQGPVLRLEKFLNKQADEDGVAPFPDYADVVRCVEKSNLKDGLGWSKAKVHKEAQALFEYCGRALQKRRQRREWKDLRSQLSREEFEADPAASDPELAAKLELNRQLALKKEAEVLEKFSRMEATSDKVSVQHNDNKTQNRDSDSSSNDKLEQVELENPYIKPESGPKYQIKEDIGEPVIRIKEEPYEVPVYFALDHSIAIEISDSDSSEDSCVE
ncbi:uncharacterized protein isoform X2 [Choristoneura fumiferana]|uniref:uncharacterized protein isoform X2 n=1 Tax=Choristoneura fumiferana TaxID=7141 RepID=UPI003D15529A